MPNKLVKNASWIIVCRIAQAILSLVVTMLTARVLEPAGYGLINYAVSLVAFVAPIAKLGLNSTLVQAFVNSPEKDGEILGTTFVMTIFSGLLCIIGVAAFVTVANPGETTTLIVCALYSLSLIFQCLELAQFYYQAKLKSKITSIVSLIAYFLVSAYKIILLLTGSSIYWFAIAQAIDYLIISFALIVIFLKTTKSKLKFSMKMAKRLFASSKYYILANLMVVVFSATDRIMLKNMMGDAYTGLYSAADTCAMMTSFVFIAIVDSARPYILERKKLNDGNFEKAVTNLYTIVIYLSLLQCIVMSILSPYIIDVIYGAEYAASEAPLKVALWYTLFSYIGTVRNVWLLAENKQRYLWIVNTCGALLNVVLNFIMIPEWGIVGAAIASLVTQFFTNVIMSLIIKPLRRNNLLMLKSLSPKRLFKILKGLKR